MRLIPTQPLLLALLLALSSGAVSASGLDIERIYDPAVNALEREVELRNLTPTDATERWTLGYGGGLAERIALEGYVVVDTDNGERARVRGYEADLRWQLTETGEYPIDWGLLVETGYDRLEQRWEQGVSVLASHRAVRWTGTVNAGLAMSGKHPTSGQPELNLRGQWRYRWRPALEPGVEVHLTEDTRAIGPMIAGFSRVATRQRLKWEVAVLAGVVVATPDAILRTQLSWEY